MNVRTGKQMAFVPAPYLFPRTQNLNISDIAVVDGGRVVLVVNSTFPDNPGQGASRCWVRRRCTFVATSRSALSPRAWPSTSAAHTTYVPNYLDDTVSYFPTPGS